MSADSLKKDALEYHEFPKPGKLSVELTKPTATQRDLALAYSPGVAEPVKEIADDPENAYRYTGKGNLVAVITEGTAVLGLGNVGALAGKPVMEGKGVLFKRFADIDVFDIEVDTDNSKDFIDTVARIAPTFGGINLEDIAAPHCFEIEETLKEMLDIPVFHDDQHGTAIIIAAALMNALDIQDKKLGDITVAILGAGAAGTAAKNLLVSMGADAEKILMLDRKGVIYKGRDGLNEHKEKLAVSSDAKKTLADAVDGADVFVGVSGPDLLSADMLKTMADKPIVFALSNPVPEIMPEVAREARDDVIIATGRSDYPNQVNNVLCFPFLFRGALDVRASTINSEMQIAAVEAIRGLAHEPVPAEVLEAYGKDSLSFGADYILPTPLDPRLKETIAPAVAQAAIDSGVARIKPQA